MEFLKVFGCIFAFLCVLAGVLFYAGRVLGAAAVYLVQYIPIHVLTVFFCIFLVSLLIALMVCDD